MVRVVRSFAVQVRRVPQDLVRGVLSHGSGQRTVSLMHKLLRSSLCLTMLGACRSASHSGPSTQPGPAPTPRTAAPTPTAPNAAPVAVRDTNPLAHLYADTGVTPVLSPE